jgi:alkylation response protein AidB-like acyl-CoA dehydrogenase
MCCDAVFAGGPGFSTSSPAGRATCCGDGKRSDETEQDRSIPDDLFSDLRAAGCFRMLVPRSHGGDELALPDALRVVETLARADGATGGWSTFSPPLRCW